MTIRPLRYELLDHWRGFAALAVLWFHAASPWFAQSVPLGLGWFAALAEEGWRGVHLFFVISGYCIAQLALRKISYSNNGYITFHANPLVILRIF